MILPPLRWLLRHAVWSSACFLMLVGLSAQGQLAPPIAPGGASTYSPPTSAIAPAYAAPGQTAGGTSAAPPPYQPSFPPFPCLPGMPSPSMPVPGPTEPQGQAGQQAQPGQQGQAGQQGTTPEGQQPTQDTTAAGQNNQASSGSGQDSSLPGEQGAAGGSSLVSFAAPGGYLDNPIPITTFRIFYEGAFNVNRPDRAEYFYGAWKEASFHPHGIQNNSGTFFDPKARGPVFLPANVDYQQPTAYFEVAARNRVSVFLQAPYRFIRFRDLQEDFPEAEKEVNPEAVHPEPGEAGEEYVRNAPTTYNGFSDLQFGFKGALLASPTRFLTFQLRTYAPTGSSSTGLGTGHWSVEPSLLYYQRFNRLVLQGQLTDWVPIDGGEAGNIIEYGLGLGYSIYQRGSVNIMPITEFLGWTVLNGYESVFKHIYSTAPPSWDLPVTHGFEQAGGQTIVNGKFGVRVFFGDGQSVYAGYGRTLTGTHWYTDIFRVEYRVFFGPLRGAARSL